MQTIKWKNLGSGFTLCGRRIRPNEIFEATEADIPRSFRDLIRPLDSLPQAPARKYRHRRYKEGKHFDYDFVFQNKFEHSQILNEEHRSFMNSEAWRMASPKGLKGLETELAERAEAAADLLEKIEENFERSKVDCRRVGKPEPEKLPADLQKLKLEGEARLDVLKEELAHIRGILKEGAAKEAEAKDDQQLLYYGPKGAGRLRDSILTEIDGQAVIVDDEGTLLINCKKSPYHNMTVENYRKLVVEPFLKAQRQKHRAWNKLTKDQKLVTPQPKLHCPVKWQNLPKRPAGF